MTQQTTQQQGGRESYFAGIVRKVKAMRNAQKMYFKYRELNWLQEAKTLEGDVDHMIKKAEQEGMI